MAVLSVIIAAILAGVIQNTAGFGAGIILMLVLPYFFDIVTSAALNAAICTGMTVILAVKYRKWCSADIVTIPLVCYIFTSTGTIWMVNYLDLDILVVAFGVFLIALSGYYMFVSENLRISSTPLTGACCGLIAGTLSGLFSVGAPAIALYFLSVTDDRDHYFGNLQFLLAITNSISLVTRAFRGIYTIELILPTMLGFCGILVGQYIGSRIYIKLNRSMSNRFIYFMVCLSGIIMLVRQFV